MISRKKLQLLALFVFALLLLQYLSSSGFGDRILPKVEYLHQKVSKHLEYKSEIIEQNNNAPHASDEDNDKSEIKEEHKVKPEKREQNHDKSEKSDEPKDRSKINEQQHYNKTKISEERNDTLKYEDSGNKTEQVMKHDDGSPDNSAQYDKKDRVNIESDSGSKISEPYVENKSPEDLTEVQLPNVPRNNPEISEPWRTTWGMSPKLRPFP